MNNQVNDGRDSTITLLDQGEVAQALKVSPKTLEYWRYNGSGPKYIKVGKLARYLLSDVNDYIQNQSRGGKA